jgi:hypothetical protein
VKIATGGSTAHVDWLVQQSGWQVSEQRDGEYLKELAAKGMTVDRSNTRLKTELKAIWDRMTAEWLNLAGADGQAVIDAYNK